MRLRIATICLIFIFTGCQTWSQVDYHRAVAAGTGVVSLAGIGVGVGLTYISDNDDRNTKIGTLVGTVSLVVLIANILIWLLDSEIKV